MKMFLGVAAALLLLAAPALADEMLTTTPPLALPEPDTPAPLVLPHSSFTQAEPLALPEPEMAPIAPYQQCSDREKQQVYLTN